nr:MAG TPA: hypothetical protein [Bacteriophage sp.]
MNCRKIKRVTPLSYFLKKCLTFLCAHIILYLYPQRKEVKTHGYS